MTSTPSNKNSLGLTREEMNRKYPHPFENEESVRQAQHIHWFRSDWKDKAKCAICGEKGIKYEQF